MKISRPVAFGMGVITALVIGSGTAYAATGGKFILGKSNAATSTTTLTNTRGTALALNSKAGTPSLRVNRTTKVPNLNADLLDGLDQSRLALSSMKSGVKVGVSHGTDTDANGIVDTFTATASCPAGTIMTGGGYIDETHTGYVGANAPSTANTWEVDVYTDNANAETDSAVYATVQCINPRGAVPGSALRQVAPGNRTTQHTR